MPTNSSMIQTHTELKQIFVQNRTHTEFRAEYFVKMKFIICNKFFMCFWEIYRPDSMRNYFDNFYA